MAIRSSSQPPCHTTAPNTPSSLIHTIAEFWNSLPPSLLTAYSTICSCFQVPCRHSGMQRARDMGHHMNSNSDQFPALTFHHLSVSVCPPVFFYNLYLGKLFASAHFFRFPYHSAFSSIGYVWLGTAFLRLGLLYFLFFIYFWCSSDVLMLRPWSVDHCWSY